MSIGKSPLVAIALALAIFGTGLGAGIAVDRLWLAPEKAHRHARRGHPSPDRLLAKFKKRLKLTDEQARAIGKILHEVNAEMREIHKGVAPAKDAVRTKSRARILEILTPEQAAEYQKIIAKEEERRKKWRGKRRRGPGANERGPSRE